MSDDVWFTFGKPWNGYVTLDGNVVPYRHVHSFGNGGWIEHPDGGHFIGKVRAHFWLAETEISEELHAQLYENNEPPER